MSEFDKILQDAQAIVSKEEAEKKRLLEEKQKELKQKEEQEKIQQKFAEEEVTWNRGTFYNNPEKFKEYIQKGHKPTFNSCGGGYEHYNDLASSLYAFYKNPHFEDIFEIACANGLSKPDADKLLRFAFTPKAIDILVEKGGADIQNYPFDQINHLYEGVTGKRKVVVKQIVDTDHSLSSVMGKYLDPEIAHSIENTLREIIKRGYDMNKSPQQAKALTSLLQNIQSQKDQESEKSKINEGKQNEKVSHKEKEHEVLNQNKLEKLRNKAAKKIDKVFGTHLEDKKHAKPIKKIGKSFVR